MIDYIFLFCKQKTAYEMRISDWSSDVCSSDRSAPRVRTLARRKVAKARGQLETVAERVFRLGDEFGAARIIGAARNLDPRYALAALPLGRPQRSDEAFARHAAYLAGIARPDLPPRGGEREAGGHAAARRRTVDLPLGENAEIIARAAIAGAERDIVGEDRAIEEAEIGFGRVRDRHGGANRVGDRHPRLDEPRDRSVHQRQAEPRGGQDGVIGAAERDVIGDLAPAGHLDAPVEMAGEGRDADEGDQRRVAPVPVDLDRDEAARRLEPEGRPAGHHRDPAAVDCPAPERDRCMAAHRTEEHTSELQSIMSILYAVICMTKK